jgi:CheY-like chemotaxis protein
VRERKLLFVDDEPTIRLTLPAILKQEGFDVTAAATVPEALAYINKEKFDVLLSDLNIGQPSLNPIDFSRSVSGDVRTGKCKQHNSLCRHLSCG